MSVSKKSIDAKLKTVEVLREKLRSAEKSTAKDIMSILKAAMVNNPLLVGFRWQQYTPNFNDGDVCEFGIHGPYFKFDESVYSVEKDPDADDPDHDSWLDAEYDLDKDWWNERTDLINHKNIAILKKTVKDMAKLFEKLSSMEDELKSMFDDGYEITVSIDGVEVEEYAHD